MELKVKAGEILGSSLHNWLKCENLQKWLEGQGKDELYALLDYVHQFAFVDWKGLLEKLRKDEIQGFSLRGRIFWRKGQIEWRKLGKEKYGFSLMLESDLSSIPLRDGVSNLREFTEEVKHEDRTLILWGIYNKEKGAFFEQRVAGSRAIEYPDVIMREAKTYPVLEIRIYLNEDGEPLFWRFLRPGARDVKDWHKEEDE
ncbi:hypothetical protein HKBW3S47_01130 [Candidatus Hakubella thermalkaliphila]|uniref:Uncharacterized protein n=1 Tax=Candidatus Hakubella thermalkaliphila TaxID=2754717 RepID=A0A6V8Q934_9ACTN|nr:hypothetical protein [Bacillota bacterium]GFP30733.1 hypothetical protein HKBW3S34_01652 [Candidatus Hakubella thermalkaliphila]GFP39431.1 hypothetical protein HKBW3S47_01130 [Candidatus Hakubella thermalkaliphila]GFP42800.1 hypothetical protein HKBW3C_01924 [Candidatus Hakubella thermalkaliphila]